ncbi:hypothetical protein Acr_02g0011940 [Actinidia rufa]|uniref:C2 tensin-type domain-containing protein n=1 Tax=Actinidia rufa TaxID=165716 RepID=A0A7J0E8Y1_9ERIC|nr:hypothetical protein Acr_02g0011940 [Actinidia rufa]
MEFKTKILSKGIGTVIKNGDGESGIRARSTQLLDHGVPGQQYYPPVEIFKSCCRKVKRGCPRPNSCRYYLSFIDRDEGANQSEPLEPHLVVQMDTENPVLYQKTCLDYYFEKPVKVSKQIYVALNVFGLLIAVNRVTGDVRVIFYEKLIGGRLFYACFNTAFIKNSLLQFSVRDMDKLGIKGKSICGPAFCLELLFGPANSNHLFSSSCSDSDFSDDDY